MIALVVTNPREDGKGALMILPLVKLRTTLSEEELLRVAHERAPAFRALPGLPPEIEVGEVLFPLRDS